jgi:hypothetical protein
VEESSGLARPDEVAEEVVEAVEVVEVEVATVTFRNIMELRLDDLVTCPVGVGDLNPDAALIGIPLTDAGLIPPFLLPSAATATTPPTLLV